MVEPVLEVCVDNPAGLAAALAGGADRIDMCAALGFGGLTPSAGLMALASKAQRRTGVPVYAMIRPRAGNFCYDDTEMAVMLADVAQARAAGLAGVVLGAGLADGGLDVGRLAGLVAAACGIGLTLHRVFDLVPDFGAALEQAVALGFRRVLTSGGTATAVQGLAELARLQVQAAGRLVIMPGAGIDADAVAVLRRRLCLREVHASCSEVMDATAAGRPGGGPGIMPGGGWDADAADVMGRGPELREMQASCSMAAAGMAAAVLRLGFAPLRGPPDQCGSGGAAESGASRYRDRLT